MERSVAFRRDGGGEGGEGTSRPAVHFCQDPQHTGGDNKEALYQKPPGILRKILLPYLNFLINNFLKVDSTKK
jgi:hypothetical protein